MMNGGALILFLTMKRDYIGDGTSHSWLSVMLIKLRELKAENERLKARMGKGDVSEEELKDMAGKEVTMSFRQYNRIVAL